MGRDEFPAEGWRVEDGLLIHDAGGGGGDIVLDRELASFELELEWRVAAGGNSGIKYRVPDVPGRIWMLGHEYQLLDDAGHPDGAKELASAAAVYALYAPVGKRLAPAGEWNHARIVARGPEVEHWLNGIRVAAFTIGGDDWTDRVAASKYAAFEGFGLAPRGLIGLQDHGDEVAFRDLRLRDLDALPGEAVELFDGASLAGWRPVGDAIFEVDDGAILGRIGGGGQSFLCSEREFGDFLLEVELKPELPGNSGIQIRSHQRENGRVYGCQVEIDSSDRAWSAGLYDEARRGWLDDLDDSPAAREAFVRGEWNRYRVECVGPSIRTWVNGVPAADWLDAEDLTGFFGLQVHSGNDTRIRWRNFRLRDLGRHEWAETGWSATALDSGTFTAGHEAPPERAALGVRLRVTRPCESLFVRLGDCGIELPGSALETAGEAFRPRRVDVLCDARRIHALVDGERLDLEGWVSPGPYDGSVGIVATTDGSDPTAPFEDVRVLVPAE